MSSKSFLLRLISSGVLAIAASGVGSAANPTAQDVARLERFLSQLQSFEAEFTQTLTDKSGHVLDESSGRLAIQRPNRFRWDYEAPAEQTIVSDGKRIWLYDPELEQVTVRQLDDTLSATPAMLLSGAGRLTDNFKVIASERERHIDWMTLEPVRRDTDFKSVKLGFAGSDLRYMQLADKLNQITRLEFNDMESNSPLDPKRFTFEPPPGADVIGEASLPEKTQ